MAKQKMLPVRVDKEMFEKLQKIAKREDRAVSYIIRKACEEYIGRNK